VRIKLDYAPDKEAITVPDRNLIGVLYPNDCYPFHDTDAALKQAADACASFLASSRRVLVLVNDYTRPTPNGPVLEALSPVLADKDVKFLVCAGTHRPPTDAEYATIFGPAIRQSSIVNRQSVMCHDSRDKSRLFFLGKTSFGTDIWLNKELLWADKVITINSIEPHYFAGYTGGRKGFLPGIAGYETITRNHNMVTHPKSLTFGLTGNPVHEDMTEAAKMLPRPVFSIQLVQRGLTDTRDTTQFRRGIGIASQVQPTASHQLLSVRFGDLFKSFDEAAADAHKVFAVPVKEKADIVLSVLGPPSNINFYQAQRAVEFARPVLRNPAVHITVSACFDGVGNDSFIQVFQGCNFPSDILSPNGQSSIVNRQSVLGWHKSARLAQIMQTAELYTVAGIDDRVVKSVFMHPFKTPQAAFDAAFKRIGPDARAYVIPDAGSVVPVLS
jgi:nickel-dependent lactate racemase